MLDGDAAGDCKGGAFVRSAPLLGFFGAPFLPKQERCELIVKLKYEKEFHYEKMHHLLCGGV